MIENSSVKNPESIIIEPNKYYPNGLTEIEIYNHYQKYKSKILKEINNRPIVLFMKIDDKIIVRRKNIILNNDIFEKVFHPRVIGCTREIDNPTNRLVIDIDPKENTREPIIKDTIKELLDSDELKYIRSSKYRIITTSKGYHIHFELKSRYDIDDLREKTKKLLRYEFKDKYGINDRTKSYRINLDLAIMTKRGSYVIPYTINRESGLVALDITNNWERYQRKDSIIK